MKFDISTIFWLFFIIAALQPLLKKRLLMAMRQRLIASLEKNTGSRVIVLEYIPIPRFKGPAPKP